MFLPVRYRYWQQRELWDGTYTISDWFDILEVIQIEEPRRVQLEVQVLQQALLGVLSPNA